MFFSVGVAVEVIDSAARNRRTKDFKISVKKAVSRVYSGISTEMSKKQLRGVAC